MAGRLPETRGRRVKSVDARRTEQMMKLHRNQNHMEASSEIFPMISGESSTDLHENRFRAVRRALDQQKQAAKEKPKE